MSDDVHSQVESAYNQLELAGGSDGGGSEGTSAPATGAAEAQGHESGAGDNGVQPPSPDSGRAAETPEGDAGRTAAERARDKAGRFAKGQAPTSSAIKTKAPEVGAPSSTDVPPSVGGDSLKPPDVTPAPTIKAPQSWTPAAREVFASLPAIAQQEIAKREKDVAIGLQEQAPLKRFQQEFSQTVSPYEGMMRAAGAQNPMQAVGTILQQWAVLQGGNAESKAHLVASIVRQSGIPIELLASAIDGTSAPQQGQQSQSVDPAALRQQIKQELMADFQGQRQQQSATQARQTADAFLADPKNEFAEDVRETMAALLSSGRAPDLQAAYDSAIWSDPGIRDILLKRQKQEAAKAITASTQQARNAASSVKSAPSTGASSVRAPKNHREMVAALYEDLDGR